jgi:hypothetical protein
MALAPVMAHLLSIREVHRRRLIHTADTEYDDRPSEMISEGTVLPGSRDSV